MNMLKSAGDKQAARAKHKEFKAKETELEDFLYANDLEDLTISTTVDINKLICMEDLMMTLDKTLKREIKASQK